MKASDKNGYSDPYVTFILGQRRASSRTVLKCLDPQWNQELRFSDMSLREMLNAPMIVQCWDWDFMKKDDPLGMGTLDLNPFVAAFAVGFDTTVILDDGQKHPGTGPRGAVTY